jgi:hypothetical protein
LSYAFLEIEAICRYVNGGKHEGIKHLNGRIKNKRHKPTMGKYFTLVPRVIPTITS